MVRLHFIQCYHHLFSDTVPSQGALSQGGGYERTTSKLIYSSLVLFTLSTSFIPSSHPCLYELLPSHVTVVYLYTHNLLTHYSTLIIHSHGHSVLKQSSSMSVPSSVSLHLSHHPTVYTLRLKRHLQRPISINHSTHFAFSCGVTITDR